MLSLCDQDHQSLLTVAPPPRRLCPVPRKLPRWEPAPRMSSQPPLGPSQGLVDANCSIWSGCTEFLLCIARGTLSCLLGQTMMEDNMRKRMHRYVCMTGSLCCTAEIDIALQLNYTLKKKVDHRSFASAGGKL